MERTPAALGMTLLLLLVPFSGCLQDDAPAPPIEGHSLPEGIFVTGPDGIGLELQPMNLSFVFSSVGEEGAEPSIGITSSGCIFFTAFEKVMRSCDHGQSWEHMNSIFQHPSTSDPWLWVDPVTDRVFDVQMVGLLTTWIAWSDDDGVNWLGNPHDSGPIPLNDHIKLGSGPWTDEGYGIPGQSDPIYEQAVYFCYNKGLGIFCYTSFDGGASFEVGGLVFGLATENGGLHGAITSAPDGTVYVTPRVETPTIVVSKDNGLTWVERTMGEDVGTPYPRKNSEVATDTESNPYHVWVGGDHGIYLSRSFDSGLSWEQTSIRLSPIEVISSTFPHIDAGDPGRIAITYLGSENSTALNQPDIDGVPWNGNPHYAPSNVSYYLYITYSLNALDSNPVFHTVRVSPDPVQVGSICLNSGDCRDIGGSNRNLLDFNDLHIDREGRVYVAFADGCIDSCASSNNSTPEDSRSRLGSVYFLGEGPSLFESIGDLAEFTLE
ncbi:MAG: sialidase family protein [Candidatus Thalassarchaeaceae archaeon]|nr:sialidase family protein [Candidatus Thalassarchaeaceae archaeon]